MTAAYAHAPVAGGIRPARGFDATSLSVVWPALADAPVAAPTDDDLLAAIAGGDHLAVSALYDRYARLALAVAWRVLDERGAAEDAVQESFLTVWRRAASFDPARGSVRGWLLTIVRNAAVDRRRGRHGWPLGDTPLDAAVERGATADDPAQTVVSRAEADRIRAALAALPPAQRQAIDLAFYGGFTHQQIADQLGVPLGTIKGRMRLGLHKLRSSLRDEG